MTTTNRTTEPPLHYDGHGLNDDVGQRVLTFAKRPEWDGGGYILDRKTMDAAGEHYAACVNAIAEHLGGDPARLGEAMRIIASIASPGINHGKARDLLARIDQKRKGD